MSESVEVHVRHTGESMRVSCSPRATVKDIIKYACGQSVCAEEMDPDDYYLSLNNIEMLDDDKTLADIDIFRMENPHLEVCMKTAIRAEIMIRALEKLRTPSAQRESHSTISNDSVRANSTTKINTKVGVETAPQLLSLLLLVLFTFV
jgi:hypothetical protein